MNDPSCFLIFLRAIVTVLLLAQAGWAADSEPASGASLRKLYVPTNRPDLWPDGDWQVLEKSEFDRLTAQKAKPNQPSTTWFSKADYFAVFTGQRLEGGTFRAELASEVVPSNVPLDPLNLNLSKLGWKIDDDDVPASWGNRGFQKEPNGRLYVRAPSVHSMKKKPTVLQGDWSAFGRKFSNRMECELELIPAVVTRLVIAVPKQWTLQISQGQLEGPTAMERSAMTSISDQKLDGNFVVWTIHLGSETQCRLEFFQSQKNRSAEPIALAQTETNYLVRERELQIEMRVDLEVAHAPLGECTFEAPRTLRIHNVSYGGDSNVEWNIRRQGSRQVVTVKLPSELTGVSRPIRIQALTRALSGRAWFLPRIRCLNAVEIRDEFYLTVEQPLELQSFETIGYRQTAMTVRSDRQETISFSRTQYAARFSVYLETPALTASARMVSLLNAGSEDWQLRTELSWTAQAGSRFQMTCDVNPGWEILDVRRVSPESPPVVSDWKLTGTGSSSRLVVEFLNALTPMQRQSVQILARRLPAMGQQPFAPVCVRPRSCRSVASLIAIELPQGQRVKTESFRKISVEQIPAFAQNSPLLANSQPKRSSSATTYLLSNSSEQNEQIQIDRSTDVTRAEGQYHLIIEEAQLSETCKIALPPEQPIDSLILIGSELDQWNWTISAIAQQPRVAEAISPVILSESDETDGQWQFSFSRVIGDGFELVGTRTQEIGSDLQIQWPRFEQTSLPFAVTVDDPTGQILKLETTGLEEHAPSEASRTWTTTADDAKLLIRLRQSSQQTPGLATVRARSLFGHTTGDCVHRVRYDVKESTPRGRFRFQIPASSRMVAVRVDNRPTDVRRVADWWVVTFAERRQRYSVEIEYKTHSSGIPLAGEWSVPLPETESRVTQCFWEFGLPSEWEISGSPSGMQLSGPAPETHWTKRFFGPIGRGNEETFFRPWDIKNWQTSAVESPSRNHRANDSFFPNGWSVYSAESPTRPANLSIQIWNRPAVRLWSVVGLLVTLIVGLGLRRWKVRTRKHIGIIWVLLHVGLAGLLPVPWASMSGACLLATILAFLFPRRWFASVPGLPVDHAKLGSTASFAHASPIVILVLGTAIMFSLRSFPEAVSVAADDPPSPNQIGKFDVLIPLQTPGKPDTSERFVYIDRQVLASLRKNREDTSERMDSWITSANYQIEITPDHAVDVIATFEVDVLTRGRAVEVVFPISNLFPGGRESCLVDRVPCPVLHSQNSQGLRVELRPSRPQTKPAIAEKPGTTPEPVKRIVVFRLHGSARGDDQSRVLSCFIPSVSRTTVDIRTPAGTSGLTLHGDDNRLAAETKARNLHAELGRASKLRIGWRTSTKTQTQRTLQEFKVASLATINPLWASWQIHIECLPEDAVTEMAIPLPPRMVVKSLETNGVTINRRLVDSNGTNLLLEFSTPRKSRFTLVINAVTPWQFPGERGRRSPSVPATTWTPAGWQVRQAESFLAVFSAPELTLEVSKDNPEPDENLVELPSDRFLAMQEPYFSKVLANRSPQFVWRVLAPCELMFDLTNSRPTQSIRIRQRGQVFRDRLEWQLKAEIQTRGAAAFRHVLIVPPSLLIDQVSVTEDETERLVRWLRSGNRVELILEDGTTGLQQLELRGHLAKSLRVGDRSAFPFIRFESGTVTDSEVSIERKRALPFQVHLTGIESWTAPSVPFPFPDREENFVPLGNWKVPVDSSSAAFVCQAFPANPTYQRAMRFESTSPSTVRMVSLIHPPQEFFQAPEKYALQIPSGLVEEFSVQLTRDLQRVVPYTPIRRADGGVDVVLDAESLQAGDLIRIDTSLRLPSEPDWSINLVSLANATCEQDWLLMTEGLPMSARDGYLFQPAEKSEWPEWIATNSPSESSFTNFQIQPARDVLPFRVTGPKQIEKTAPAKLTSTVWLSSPQQRVGRTVLACSEETEFPMRWTWKPGRDFQAATWNGTPITAQPTSDGAELVFPNDLFRSSREAGELVLSWSEPSTTGLLGTIEIQPPTPVGTEPEQNQLSVICPTHLEIIPRNGATLLDANEPGRFPSVSTEMHQESSSVKFWMFDRRLPIAAGIFGVILVVGGLLWRGLRWDTGAWFSRHTGTAVALLGAFWWLFLAQGAWGFFVLMLGPALVVYRNRRLQQRLSGQIQ